MENESLFKPNPKLKLMDQVREVLRYYHYAYRTEQTYCKWIMRFIRFFEGKKRSEDLRSGAIRRPHVLPSGLQKAIKRAVHKARIHKKAGIKNGEGLHTLRHSEVYPPLEDHPFFGKWDQYPGVTKTDGPYRRENH